MSDNETTRDIAIEAMTTIEQHIDSCDKRYAEIKAAMIEIGSDLKSLNTRVLLIIGGLIVLSKLADVVIPFIHH